MARVKMFPASNGDCFLIRGGGVNVLIDGGYAATFELHVLPELTQIAREGQRLDLLVATHIDQDHILGIIALLEANGPAVPRTILEIDAIWFNSLRCMASQVSATLSLRSIATWWRSPWPSTQRLTGTLSVSWKRSST